MGRDRVGDSLDDPGCQVEDPGTGAVGSLDRASSRRAVTTSRCDIDRLDDGTGVERRREQFCPFDDQGALGAPQVALAQQLPDVSDPLVGVGQPVVGQDLASVLGGPPTSASLATCTSAVNASGSLTARSARTFRSTATSAR